MGGGRWSSDNYVAAASTRKAAGLDDFGHDADVRAGRANGIHDSLDPKTVAGPLSPLAGQNVRESRDSDEHPNSLPIGIVFDVTASMGGVPMVLQKKLANLMDVVIDKAEVADPQILVGAVGDSTCDEYPFQIGQFESDNRFDEQLRQIIIERGGGGQVMESYGLAWRFAAYHTATDAWEKRGKKGYFFTMGDEMPWPTVPKSHVAEIFGVEAEADETIEDLLLKVQEKWEVFHIHSMDGSYPNRKDIDDRWRTLLGERFIKIKDSALVCEVIAGVVHMLETAYDVNRVVSDIGLTGKDATAVKNALVPVSEATVPAHVAKGNVPEAKRKKRSGVSRI